MDEHGRAVHRTVWSPPGQARHGGPDVGHQVNVLMTGDTRALCRIKLLPVTHVLVDTWMLTVKPVYKLLNVSDELKWTTNTCDTIFTLTFKA